MASLHSAGALVIMGSSVKASNESLYRKRPVVVRAQRHTGPSPITIHTLEGDMTAMPGDWIITGVAGETYACKPDIFEQTYERFDH